MSHESLFLRSDYAPGAIGWPALFVIQRVPTLGLNPMLRQHWKKREEEQNAWTWELACALEARDRRWLRVPAIKKQRMRLWIRFYWQTRRLDPDNLSAAAKNILDALKNLRFIRNDSARWIELIVQQALVRQNLRVGSQGPETHIWLEPVGAKDAFGEQTPSPPFRLAPPASRREGR